jgi:hypothetical protein
MLRSEAMKKGNMAGVTSAMKKENIAKGGNQGKANMGDICHEKGEGC